MLPWNNPGVVDGIGMPDCFVELYDLDANTRNDVRPAAPAGTARPMQTCDEAREYARAALKGYGIDKKHQGSTLTLDPQSGEPDPDGTARKITAMDFLYKNKACRLKLYKKSDEGNNPWGRTMINWNVGLSCGNEKERMILSEEWSNFSVKIEEARIVGDRLVLFPATTYQDFEEPGSSTGVIGIVIDQTPPEGIKLDDGGLGFSDGGDLFGYWLSGADRRPEQPRLPCGYFIRSSGRRKGRSEGIRNRARDQRSQGRFGKVEGADEGEAR